MELWFGDWVAERRWSGPSRTVTEADVDELARFTGDRLPMHSSERGRRPRAPIRHRHRAWPARTLDLSRIDVGQYRRTGRLGHRRPESSRMALRQPIRVGNCSVVCQSVANVRPQRRVVSVEVRALNQDGAVVQHGMKPLLVARQENA